MSVMGAHPRVRAVARVRRPRPATATGAPRRGRPSVGTGVGAAPMPVQRHHRRTAARVRRDRQHARAEALQQRTELDRDDALARCGDVLARCSHPTRWRSRRPADPTASPCRSRAPRRRCWSPSVGNVVAVLPDEQVPKSRSTADSDAIATGSVVPVPPSAITIGAFDAFEASDTLADSPARRRSA